MKDNASRAVSNTVGEIFNKSLVATFPAVPPRLKPIRINRADRLPRSLFDDLIPLVNNLAHASDLIRLCYSPPESLSDIMVNSFWQLMPEKAFLVFKFSAKS